MEAPVIKAEKLSKRYGSFTAVNQLDLTIRKGEIYGLLGPNGAGKSTTILMMLGLSEPSSGNITVCGWDATRNTIAIKRKVGYLPEDVRFYEDMTGLENLVFTARLNGLSPKEAGKLAHKLLDRVGLGHAGQKKTGTYSRGMRQRLGLADVLIKNPEVIILDEPTLGIDPIGVSELLKLINKLSKEEKISVLLSSHHLHEVQRICDRVGLFVGGEKIAEGTIDSLSQTLFGKAPFQIELVAKQEDGQPVNRAELEALLGHLPEITDMETTQGGFRLSCTQNIAPEMAKIIVGAGLQLQQLSEKKPGLDEIYQRYFTKEKYHEV